jgi:uncharacterized protein YndB with AHSA1/START domain
MENMKFSVAINAPVEKVFENMLGQDGYPQWTSVFNPSSSFEGTWAQDEKISFIGISKEGKKEGLVGIVRQFKPNDYVSIEYIGLLDGDQVISEGKEVESWVGSHENYTFKANGNQTIVTVDLDVVEPYIGYFKETYPKALEKLKQITEPS